MPVVHRLAGRNQRPQLLLQELLKLSAIAGPLYSVARRRQVDMDKIVIAQTEPLGKVRSRIADSNNMSRSRVIEIPVAGRHPRDFTEGTPLRTRTGALCSALRTVLPIWLLV